LVHGLRFHVDLVRLTPAAADDLGLHEMLASVDGGDTSVASIDHL
jgi:hypothetical protein